jgi:hypothetical protein
MLRKTLSVVALAAVTSLGACTSHRAPTTHAAMPTASKPCATVQNTSGIGMLQVNQVWPANTASSTSFTTSAFSSRNCSTSLSVNDGPPQCKTRPFPWILTDTLSDEYGLLSKTGAQSMINAVITGSPPAPNGKGNLNQEVDEQVIVLDRPASSDFLTIFANTCGRAVHEDGTSAFLVNSYNPDLKRDVVAYYLPSGHNIIWLEFNSTGWTSSQYTRIIRLAIHDTAALG